MDFSFNFFVFISFILFKSAFAHVAPVYIFGKTLPKISALTTISSTKIGSLLQPDINNNIIVTLITPTLDIEDITRCKENCLFKFSPEFSYLPSVEDPLNLFSNAKTASLDTIFSQINAGEKFLRINLNENPAEVLPKLYESLRKSHPNVVLILTGHRQSSLRLKKRSLDLAPLESRHLRIAAQGISERNGEKPETFGEIQSIATKLNGSSLYATLFPLNFTLKFILQGNVWSLKSGISNEGILYAAPKYVTAVDSYSYRCEGNLTFQHRKDVIKILNSQILVSFREDHPKFDLKKVFYCDSYATPGILSGLLVVAVIVGVLICSLMAMADIRTMDRFDNQRSKGLMIVADD